MLEVKERMPVVIIETWTGKSEDQKATLIKGITEVFEEIGVTADQVTVIIHDVPKANWGTRGQQASRLPPNP
jgi:4-oxalocrotonate tautomerase